MENRNVIIAIIAGLLVLGGVGYAAYTGGAKKAEVTPSIPAQQLVGSEQPAQQKSSSDGQAHSTE